MPPSFMPLAVWIVNASPFIGLAKAGYLDALLKAGRTVLMPADVAGEVRSGPGNDAAVQALAAPILGLTILPPVTITRQVAAFELDADESAVLTETLARPGSVALIDETRARGAAAALGVPVTGSLGVLLLAKKEGRMAELIPAIRALQSVGIFLPGESKMRSLLRSYGETWP